MAIVGLWTGLTALGGALGAMTAGKHAIGAIKKFTGGANTNPGISKGAAVTMTGGDLNRLLGDFIIEPLIIASEDATESDVFDKAVGVSMDIFAGYYLQAFEVLTNVHGLNTDTAISLLGTDNGMKNAGTAGISAAFKAAGWALNVESPGLTIDEEAIDFSRSVMTSSGDLLTFEAATKKGNQKNMHNGFKRNNNKNINRNVNKSSNNTSSNTVEKTGASGKITGNKFSSDEIGYGVLQRNLSVAITVKNSAKERRVEIPITVRGSVVGVKLDTIVTALKPGKRSASFTERFIDYRAGMSSLSNLLFSSDMINEYKKERLKDGSDYYAMRNSRKTSSNLKLLSDKAMGYERKYNCFIITEEDKKIIDRESRSDIYRPGQKEKVLNALDALTMIVLDEDREIANFLTTETKGTSKTPYKKLLKSKGDNAGEVLKALLNQKPLSF